MSSFMGSFGGGPSTNIDKRKLGKTPLDKQEGGNVPGGAGGGIGSGGTTVGDMGGALTATNPYGSSAGLATGGLNVNMRGQAGLNQQQGAVADYQGSGQGQLDKLYGDILGGLDVQGQQRLKDIDAQTALMGRRNAAINAGMGASVGGGFAGGAAQAMLGGMQQRGQAMAQTAGQRQNIQLQQIRDKIRQKEIREGRIHQMDLAGAQAPPPLSGEQTAGIEDLAGPPPSEDDWLRSQGVDDPGKLPAVTRAHILREYNEKYGHRT